MVVLSKVPLMGPSSSVGTDKDSVAGFTVPLPSVWTFSPCRKPVQNAHSYHHFWHSFWYTQITRKPAMYYRPASPTGRMFYFLESGTSPSAVGIGQFFISRASLSRFRSAFFSFLRASFLRCRSSFSSVIRSQD